MTRACPSTAPLHLCDPVHEVCATDREGDPRYLTVTVRIKRLDDTARRDPLRHLVGRCFTGAAAPWETPAASVPSDITMKT